MSLVHIVGAGPTGGAAAISALRSGFSVQISEDHKEIGIPTHCSGLFSHDGLESLKEFFNYKKLITNPIHGAVLDFAGEKLTIRTKEPIAYVCDRARLDQEMVGNAISEGAKINYNERIISIDQLRSNIVIGADGPISKVAQLFNFPKIAKYASTLQGHFKYKGENPDLVEVFLGKEKFPGFFGWIIPHSETFAEVGVGVEHPYNVVKAWEHILKIAQVERSECKPKGAVIPIRVRKKTGLSKDKFRVCLVGDAAGQTKSSTGGGVIFGSNCARYAGKYCENPLRYELEWKARFAGDLFIHKNAQAYLEKMSDVQIQNLGKKFKKLGIESYLSNHGHMDKPSRMIKPQMLGLLARAPGLLI